MVTCTRTFCALLFLVGVFVSSSPRGLQAWQEQEQSSDGFVDFKTAEGQPLDLQTLVRQLQNNQGLRIYFDNGVFPKPSQVVFYGEPRVREGEQHFHFVQLVLRNSGLAIVESELDRNLHKIVQLADVRPYVPRRDGEGDVTEGLDQGEYVTAVFSLRHIPPGDAKKYLMNFILKSGTQATSSPNNQNDVNEIILELPPDLLIVTELVSRIDRIKAAITNIDVPQVPIKTVFRDVVNLEAKALETQLRTIMEQQDKVQDELGSSSNNNNNNQSAVLRAFRNIQISSDDRTNRLILIGTQVAIDRVDEIIRELDQSLELTVHTFHFTYIPPGRVDSMIRQTLPADSAIVDRFYQSTINESDKSLTVTARADILDRIQEIKTKLDIEASDFKASNPVEFYKLKHVKAADILDTLQRVVRQYRPDLVSSQSSGNIFGRQDGRGININSGVNNREGFRPSGTNFPDNNIDGQLQRQNFVETAPGDPVTQREFGRQEFANRFDPFSSQAQAFLQDTVLGTENIVPGEAQITVEENTNTLIVVAEPQVQELYREIIEKLDVYRPQVLVEVTVVTLDAQEDFNLGIEVSGGDRNGTERAFSFTSFGLSEVDPASGSLTITPGLGFNGTLVDPDVADVVLRALSRHRRARVISAPRILVNDNATGLLSSVAEVPFQSINASNTVATTSFAGFATAGTTVSVTPQISEGNYLNLEFDVLVNDFTGAGNEALPPPRNTDQVTSQVSIPDGSTVIVGGLTRQRNSIDEQRIPFLEDIPAFEFITGNTSDGSRDQRLFVFIKPTILKDDKFKDLQYISEVQHREACIPGDYPQSGPLLIR